MLCLCKKKTHVVFFIFHLEQLSFSPYECPGLCHKGKMKVALNEKRKKLHGFSFSINIANFEAFLSVFKLTKNPLFLKSVPRYFRILTYCVDTSSDIYVRCRYISSYAIPTSYKSIFQEIWMLKSIPKLTRGESLFQ